MKSWSAVGTANFQISQYIQWPSLFVSLFYCIYWVWNESPDKQWEQRRSRQASTFTGILCSSNGSVVFIESESKVLINSVNSEDWDQPACLLVFSSYSVVFVKSEIDVLISTENSEDPRSTSTLTGLHWSSNYFITFMNFEMTVQISSENSLCPDQQLHSLAFFVRQSILLYSLRRNQGPGQRRSISAGTFTIRQTFLLYSLNLKWRS